MIAAAETAAALSVLVLAVTAGAIWVLRERARSIKALTEKRYNILESIPDGIFIVDDEWRFTHVNERAEEMLRRTASELVGTRIQDVFDPLASELYPDMVEVRSAGEPLERLHHFQSTNTWMEVRIQPARDELLVYLRDITERKRAELQSRESERRLRLVLSQAPAVLWTCDMLTRVTSISGAALSDRGLREDDIIGRTLESLFQDEQERRQAKGALLQALSGEAVRFESHEDGRWMQNDIEPLRDEHGEVIGAAGVSLDVTDVREAANRFAALARQDVMTHLPNRLALDELLPPLLAKSAEADAGAAVLFVDVDRFKTINDTLGHSAGDELLRIISRRFLNRAPEDATICRFGGDEFVIVLGGIPDKTAAEKLAVDLIGCMADPFVLQGHELAVTVSIGASMFPENGRNAEELIAYADEAMYRAKEAGGNTVQFYDGIMHAHALQRLGLERDLRFALARGELSLQYQPIVDIKTHRVIAAEALLRWNHPEMGELSPHTFVSIAEETQAIVPIDRWVLREACKTAARIRESLVPDFRIAVNLSPRDLQDSEFATRVMQTLKETGLPAEALDLEVTENVMVKDASAAVLTNLAAMGVKICVDDFGTGYSALGYIKRLPVDAIKIDKSFIRDVARDPHDQGIVKAISTLAQTLGLRLIAEGVENDAQCEFVKELDCRHVQGYFFHRPLSWPALWDTLRYAYGTSSRRSERVISLY